VVPSPTDPAIGQVLSSDGQKTYHIGPNIAKLP
jgi:hypothetical protein